MTKPNMNPDVGNMSRESYIRCTPKQETLEQAITVAINRFSAENGSDTPDFILAAYLHDCLQSFNRASRWREKWYSPEGVPVDERNSGPKPPYDHIASVKDISRVPARPDDPIAHETD